MSQGTHPKNERRKHTRAKFQDSVVVHKVIESKSGNVYEVQGNPLVVKALDLSEGGIRLEIGSDPSSKILKLNFQVQKNKPMDIYSKLAWTEKGTCGLEFIVADEQIRLLIRNYVERSK